MVTLTLLQEIPKTIVFIISPQREQAAKSGTVCMDRAPPFIVQKRTTLLFRSTGRHLNMQKDHGVHDAHRDLALCKELICILSQAFLKTPDIIRVQKDRVAHGMATFRAALAPKAVCLHHVICRIQFSVGYLLEGDVPFHGASMYHVSRYYLTLFQFVQGFAGKKRGPRSATPF